MSIRRPPRSFLAAFALACLLPLAAMAQWAPDARPITWFQCKSGNATPSSITTGGTAQSLFGSTANVKFPIRGLYVANPTSTQGIGSPESLFLNFAGTATMDAASIEITTGSSVTLGPASMTATAPSVVAATSAHKFTCYYGQ